MANNNLSKGKKMQRKYILMVIACSSFIFANENNLKDNDELTIAKMKKHMVSEEVIKLPLQKIKYTMKGELSEDIPTLVSYKINEVNLAKIDHSDFEKIFNFITMNKNIYMGKENNSELLLKDNLNRTASYITTIQFHPKTIQE
jgi:hypothetical protein